MRDKGLATRSKQPQGGSAFMGGGGRRGMIGGIESTKGG